MSESLEPVEARAARLYLAAVGRKKVPIILIQPTKSYAEKMCSNRANWTDEQLIRAIAGYAFG